MTAPCFLGVDVGTGSARAGVFDAAGRMLGTAKRDLLIFNAPGGIAEQSSAQIWQAVCEAVCEAVREACSRAGVGPEAVAGIGFDATCSLVVLGANGQGLPVGPSEDPARNVMLWMDHRAIEQAERINAGAHAVLDYVGRRISPEMETPKLLWLAEHRPAVFAAAHDFLDLTDFLTLAATGSRARSTCTVTCKWTYLAHEGKWDAAYFRAIGLGALADEGFARIGTKIAAPGTKLGAGLTQDAASAFGVRAGTPVGAGLIDAHAGGVGSVGMRDVRLPDGGGPDALMAYVMGTSSCTMTTTRERVFAPGIWGPYHSAMVPGAWLLEGGQSAAGAAIAALLRHHPLHDAVAQVAASEGIGLPDLLARRALAAVGGDASAAIGLARGLHVVPEFLGNRAPHADPHTRAAIVGLDMTPDEASLTALYVAGVAGLGYGLRQILDAQAAAGAPVRAIAISGGAGRSGLVRQMLADATGLPVAVPATAEPVLLGAAMLGSVAAGASPDLETAMRDMSALDTLFVPGAAHDERYATFVKLQSLTREASRT